MVYFDRDWHSVDASVAASLFSLDLEYIVEIRCPEKGKDALNCITYQEVS